MRHRKGISLVEVLVVIAVIGIILAIAIPAVQSSRESARRIQCQNNLRQLMVAVQSHHDNEGDLPSLYNATSLPRPLTEWDLFHTHSWRVPLLPYIEQAALHKQIDFDALATGPENQKVAQSVIAGLLCPSGGDPMEMGWGLKHEAITGNFPNNDPPESLRYHVVRSDYDAMAGIQSWPDEFPANSSPNSVEYVHWGIWGWPVFSENPEDGGQMVSGSKLIRYRPGKFRDVQDGLSNTIALVERGGKPTAYVDGQPDVTKDNPDAVYPGQVGWSASNTFSWSLNGDNIGVNQSNSRGIYAFHPSGANVALADGSVRFLSDATDFETLIALYGRADGGLPE